MANNWETLWKSNKQDWTTPRDFFNRLDEEFHFTLDAAATSENALCPQFFSPENSALDNLWTGRVFCNPPYSRDVKDWVEYGYYQHVGKVSDIIVMLLFARTDTKWFHKYCYGKAELRFIEGRLKFGDGKNSAPAPSMLVIWRNGCSD